MSPNKRTAIVILCICLPMLAAAQELEIPISPSPVGSGARAAGMADAFVAIADDATAASWNPAGLVQLERPEISVVSALNAIQEAFHADDLHGFDTMQTGENLDLNYFSMVYPLPWLIAGRNVSLALNYQRKYDFSRAFDVSFSQALLNNAGNPRLRATHWSFEQDGGLSTVTPALAFEITHRLSLGAALNLWRSTPFDENGWTQVRQLKGTTLAGNITATVYDIQRESYENVRGENITLGLLWNFLPKWNLGLRYDSAFTAKANYARSLLRLDNQFPSGNSNTIADIWHETRHIRFPSTAAIGLAYRHDDRLTLSLDVTRTDWTDFYTEKANGRKTSLIDGQDLNLLPEDIAGVNEPEDLIALFRPHVYDPTYTVRLGAEYLCIPKEPQTVLNRLWTLRGGLFYDQEAAAGRPDNFYGMAAGIGLLLNQRVNLDLAYQLRYGNHVNEDYIRGVDGYNEDVFQHRILLSTVIYF